MLYIFFPFHCWVGGGLNGNVAKDGGRGDPEAAVVASAKKQRFRKKLVKRYVCRITEDRARPGGSLARGADNKTPRGKRYLPSVLVAKQATFALPSTGLKAGEKLRVCASLTPE